ncbi:lyase family protein [Streptomyces sp. NBC_01465]|uniref:lyase family protein n=1 Tax=Streptomyces sp. NBC_01465 TaxID=2903878 RepID=UPI002E374661|nr:lyase family protein [Streptomyces sp. NBC_01465]
MTSAEETADVGLLSPVSAGTRVEAATGDAAYLQAMVDAEVALLRARGLAADGVDAGDLDVRALALKARAGGNPVIPLVEELRVRLGPETHRGATSQDILDTATMLVARESVALIVEDLQRAAKALEGLAREHRNTPMPARTLTQHAVPTTFGLKAAGWRSLVLDARDRLQRLAYPAQLGGAAGTLAALSTLLHLPPTCGQSFRRAERVGTATTLTAESTPVTGSGAEPQFREGVGPGPQPAAGAPPTPYTPLTLVNAYADNLNLTPPPLPWHTLRTPITDLATTLAFTTTALGKLAADVLTLTRTEVAELSEGEGGTSSAMPHKQNPVHATLITSAARQAPHLAATLLTALLAEDERPPGAWHAEWHPLRTLLRLTAGAAEHAAALTATLRVDPARMRANLDLTGGLIISERLTATLGRARTEELIAESTAKNIPLKDLIPDKTLTDPAQYTGAAAELVDRALERQ